MMWFWRRLHEVTLLGKRFLRVDLNVLHLTHAFGIFTDTSNNSLIALYRNAVLATLFQEAKAISRNVCNHNDLLKSKLLNISLMNKISPS